MKSQMLRYLTVFGAVTAIVTANMICSSLSWAQWPVRPIRIVVGYAAGGGNSMAAQIVAPKLSEMFNQPVIVDNRPGAAGMIGESIVAKATPDGHTLLLDAPGAAMNPSLYRNPLFEPKELQPVAQLVSLSFVIVINPQLRPTDLKALIEHIKKNPKGVNAAIAGPSTQLVTELFKLTTDVELTLIPYKGGAPANVSVIAGETQFMFSSIAGVSQHIAAGRLRPLAVTAGKRVLSLPNVPTARESGLPDFEVNQWFGVFAPAGTPSGIVGQLNAALNKIVLMPDVASKFAHLGAEPVTSSADEFSRFYRSEVARWKDVVVRAKIPLNNN